VRRAETSESKSSEKQKEAQKVQVVKDEKPELKGGRR
jgi:hypothetical protein